MKKLLFFLIAAILLALPQATFSQMCINGEGNIFNETLIIGADAAASLGPNDRIIALAGAGCVGASPSSLPNPASTAIALTIWHDDDLTPEVDGLLPGEAFRIYAQRPSGTLLPLVFSKTHEPDGIYEAIEAAFDTTLTAFIDSLSAEIVSMETTFDSLMFEIQTMINGLEFDLQVSRDSSDTWETRAFAHRASRDSLQAIVDNFPDVAEVQALRDDLTTSNARVAVLEGDLTAANGRVSGLLNAFRNFLNRMRSR